MKDPNNLIINATIDTNALVDVEERRKGYENVQKLFQLDNEGAVNLFFPAVIANEKWIRNKLVDNFNKFISYLKLLGIKKPKTLPPLGFIGFMFIDHVILFEENGPEFELANKLKKILFPNFEHDYRIFCSDNNWDPYSDSIHPKFRNMKIDSLVLWCHIYHKKNILVSRDENFKKKLSNHDEFKNIVIMTPAELIESIKKIKKN